MFGRELGFFCIVGSRSVNYVTRRLALTRPTVKKNVKDFSVESARDLETTCMLVMCVFCQVMCLSVAVANVQQPKNEIELNVQLAANFLASLLKKNWQNIKVRRYCRRRFRVRLFLCSSFAVAALCGCFLRLLCFVLSCPRCWRGCQMKPGLLESPVRKSFRRAPVFGMPSYCCC